MVEIVVPLRVETAAAGMARLSDAHVIEVALGDYIDTAIELGGPLLDGRYKFLEERLRRMVDDRVNSIEAESVYMEVCDPVQCILDEEAADFVAFRAVKVESRTPWCAIPVSKIGAELPKIIAFRAQMVIDHIKYDGDALLVTGLDERF